MSLGNWNAIRRTAGNLHAKLRNSSAPNTPIADLLTTAFREIGFSCSLLPANDTLLYGALAVLDQQMRTVWVSRALSPEQRSLVLAHELGHYHLHHQQGEAAETLCLPDDLEVGGDAGTDAIVGYGPRQRREAEANVFAREFLLPVSLIRRLFDDEGLDATTIAAKTGVSLTVVFAQLADALIPEEVEEPTPEPTFAALDLTQEQAVQIERGPSLILAGPGTGKTHTLAARALYLTEQGVPPENILALTFSRRATEEMRARIGVRSPLFARRMTISTFHAYGLELLRRHWQIADLPPRPVLLDSAEVYALLERHITDVPLDTLRYLHDPAYPLRDLLSEITRAKEQMLTPDDYAARAAASKPVAGQAIETWEKHRETALVYALYEKLLRERGALDFADLISRALRLLENPEILRIERAQWQHILVDEYQDINPASAKLLHLLAGEGTGLWTVGDARQTIYSFRGASSVAIEQFKSDFPNGQILPLGVNYRSRPALVLLFGTICGEGSTAWEPTREGEGTVTLAVAATAEDQVRGIAEKIRGFVTDTSHIPMRSLSEIAVLCRTRNQAQAMRDGLRAQGIPVQNDSEENDLLKSSEVRHLLALLSAAVEPEGAARQYLQNRSETLPDLPTYSDAFAMLAYLLWGSPAQVRQVSDRHAVARLLSLARAFRERTQVLQPTQPNREPVAVAFLNHLRRLGRMGVSLPIVNLSEADAVHVLTIHAAKGLQFGIVFVPNLSDGKFPSRSGPDFIPTLVPRSADEQRDEENRLFFVALTRAKDHVILSRALKYKNRSAKPSPLLSLLEPYSMLQHETWAFEKPEIGETEPETDTIDQQNPLLSLDAWEAELYLRCPRRYYYERVQQLPTGLSTPYANLKRAVRHAFKSDAPISALEASWDSVVFDSTYVHPHTSFYRAAAEKIVEQNIGIQTTSQSLVVERNAGTILLNTDAADSEGTQWEYRHFKKPPKKQDAAPSEPRLSLLHEAAEQFINPNQISDPDRKEAITISVRYLQNGLVLPTEDKPKQREKHLAKYDRALRGIRLRVFPPEPDESSNCPLCPYYFICPD